MPKPNKANDPKPAVKLRQIRKQGEPTRRTLTTLTTHAEGDGVEGISDFFPIGKNAANSQVAQALVEHLLTR